MDENVLDFNFWPSFADLMLVLVLILVIVFVVVAVIPANAPDSTGTDDLAHVNDKQRDMIDAIAAEYGVAPNERKEDYFEIPIKLEDGRQTAISIQNEPTLQRFSFRDRILFEPDEYVLNEDGKRTLLIVGKEIKSYLDPGYIREIQIQGHADTDRSVRFPSNLHLAAQRAIEVFKFFQAQVLIDPATHLMSATSFGEFKPVQRSIQDSYSDVKLQKDNSTEELKAQNRRIEILLFYQFAQVELGRM